MVHAIASPSKRRSQSLPMWSTAAWLLACSWTWGGRAGGQSLGTVSQQPSGSASGQSLGTDSQHPSGSALNLQQQQDVVHDLQRQHVEQVSLLHDTP